MKRTLIPPLSGVFSALGLLLANPSSDASRTVMLEEGSTRLAAVTQEILDEAERTYRSDHGMDFMQRRAWAEIRYAGQSHELTVSLVPDWSRLRRTFEAMHQARFGFSRAGEGIELVDVRAEVIGGPPITWADLPPIEERAAPTVTDRGREVPIYSRDALSPGIEIEGPAVVIERDSAVWLEPGDRMSVHEDGTLDVAS
jgi:N-methylhydantoinase A